MLPLSPSTFVNSPDLNSIITYQPDSKTLTLSSLRERGIRTFVGSILSCARWSADSKLVALGFVGESVLILEATGTLSSLSFGRRQPDRLASSVAEMAWSPDCRLLAVATSRGEIRILKPASSHLLTLDHLHPSGVRSLSWSGHGSLLASASTDGWIIIWNSASGQPLCRWHCPLPVGELVWRASHLLVKSHGMMIQAIPLRPPTSSGLS